MSSLISDFRLQIADYMILDFRSNEFSTQKELYETSKI